VWRTERARRGDKARVSPVPGGRIPFKAAAGDWTYSSIGPGIDRDGGYQNRARARARRQVKRVGDFTFDLISVSLISRVANERSQSFSVANGPSSSRSAKTESGFSASGRRTKGDNTRCRDHADRSETKCFQSTWDFFHPCYPARLCQDHMYKSPIPPIKVPV